MCQQVGSSTCTRTLPSSVPYCVGSQQEEQAGPCKSYLQTKRRKKPWIQRVTFNCISPTSKLWWWDTFTICGTRWTSSKTLCLKISVKNLLPSWRRVRIWPGHLSRQLWMQPMQQRGPWPLLSPRCFSCSSPQEFLTRSNNPSRNFPLKASHCFQSRQKQSFMA